LTLAALSPDVAAGRILQLPHDAAVDLFAHESAKVLAPAMNALLRVNEATAVAILADLNSEKAGELIRPCADTYPWLDFLSDAAESIAREATRLRWDRAPGAGRMERAAPSPQGTRGYVRQYGQGRLYWDAAQHRACAVRGPIAQVHEASGGTGGELGFPRSKAEPAESAWGTTGDWQQFEGDYIASSGRGTFRVPETIADGIGLTGLGFPIASAGRLDDVESQGFEGGTVYSSGTGTFAVRSEVATRVARGGWVPVSAEEDAGSCQVQRFRDTAGALMAMYWSSGKEPLTISGPTLAFYDELGGPGSWLGLPTAMPRDQPEGGTTQAFEHGRAYTRPGCDVVAVPAETDALVGRGLGWPLSGEKPVDGSAGERIQFFEHGVVTLRQGKRQIWRGPEPASLFSPFR
jgi:hypothetical protein